MGNAALRQPYNFSRMFELTLTKQSKMSRITEYYELTYGHTKERFA